MNFKQYSVATAIFASLGVALPAAQAQTLSVSKAGTGPYTFTVTVSPATTINTITFDFNGLVNFTSSTGPFSAPAFGPTPTAVDSSYTFFGPGFTPQTFGTEMFTFTPGTGSTATTYNITVGGPTFAAVNSGLLAAPEPGSLVSMTVLSACLGLGIIARRRKMISN